MNDQMQKTSWNEPSQTMDHGAPEQPRRPQRKKNRVLRRLTALTLSAALFGTVSAGTFYGLNQLLPQEDSSTTAVSTASSTGDAVLSNLSSTAYSGVRYGMDVSDIAADALPSVVAITNISVQEVNTASFTGTEPTAAVNRCCILSFRIYGKVLLRWASFLLCRPMLP